MSSLARPPSPAPTDISIAERRVALIIGNSAYQAVSKLPNTVNDAKAYTRPWTVLVRQTAVLDTELLDAICLENEKDAPHLPRK